MSVRSITQNEPEVKSIAPYQSNRTAILELADHCLEEAQRFHEKYLAEGDGLAWRRWGGHD